MKNLLYTLIFAGCFFSSDLLSQQRPFGPTHPKFFYTPVRPRLNVDSIVCYGSGGVSMDPVTGEILETTPQKYYYHRSEDLLTDTVYYETSLLVCRYNDKNQLLYDYQIRKYAPSSAYMKTNYEYDGEGRVVRLERNWVEPSRNPSAEPKITFESEKIWDYSTIKMTEKGYIFEGVECELDNHGRITLIKNPVIEDTIVEYIDGNKYHVNYGFYTYTDSSYTEFGCFYVGNRTMREEPIQWWKSTYVYDEDGYLKSSVSFVSDDGINWRNSLDAMWYFTQTNSGNDEVSNLVVEKTKTVVYAHSGAILIFVENAAKTQIFDLTGRLVKQQALSAGENRISINKGGFYIVKIGEESFKVYVR